mgnify:CR=1 FL=1
MNSLNIGVIGLGIGEAILKDIAKLNTNDNFFIFDFNKEKTIEVASMFPNVNTASSFQEIIENKNISLVYIASYDEYHLEQIKQCIRFGKHILVEKPAVTTQIELEELKKIISLNPNIMINMNMVLRENPLFKEINKLIEKSFFGKIYNVELSYYWGRVWKFDEWRSNEQNYHIIQGAGIHLIDLIYDWNQLNIKPLNISVSDNAPKIGNSPSLLKINNKTADGSLININIYGPSSHPHYHQLTILGSEASFELSYSGAIIYIKNNNKSKLNDFNIKLKEEKLIKDHKNEFLEIKLNLEEIYPRKDLRFNLLQKYIDLIRLEKFEYDSTLRTLKVMDYCFKCQELLRKCN